MGGIPTNVDAEVLRNNTDVVRGLYAAGEVACVSRARLQPPGHQLAARHQRVRQARRHRRRRVRADRVVRGAARGPRGRRRRGLEEIRTRPDGERVAGHPQGAAGVDGPQRPGVPHRRVARRRRSTTSRRCRSGTGNVRVQDKGKRFNTDLLEAVELGFLLDIAEVGRRRRPTARSPAAGTCATTSRTATTRTTCSTRWPTGARCPSRAPPGHRRRRRPQGLVRAHDGVRRLPARAGLQARHDDPLPADGE